MVGEQLSIFYLVEFSVSVVCVWVRGMCVCVCGACRGQKKALGPLKLELQAVMSHLMWVLGTGPLQEQ